MSLKPLPSSRIAAELIVASLVVLFQELTLIRWMGGQVRVLAYFPNLILISAFLGLGVGCLLAGRRSLLWAWPVSLLLLTGATSVMSGVAFTQRSTTEHLWLLYYDLPRQAPVVSGIRLPVILSFVLGAGTFVPLGQIVAERIQELRRRSSALWGYGFDIAGSICGVLLFSVMGTSGTFPVHWFVVCLALGGLFFARRRLRAGVAYALIAIAVAGLVYRAERSTAYSPYYALRLERIASSGSLEVLANGSFHQRLVGMRRGERSPAGDQLNVVEGYHVPYEFLGRLPRSALVLGAGTGNDVAALLDQGAERIDAVEIDPVILEWGREHHPDNPYASPRVRAFNTDARSYLNQRGDLYDLIVFGTLDSMTRLSALSNVRLDNFVYTVESIRAAKARLSPGGGLVLYFMVSEDYIAMRLVAMLSDAFGEVPLVYTNNHGLFNTILMAGPAFEAAPAQLVEANRNRTRELMQRGSASVQVPRDEWPFLYLRERGIGVFYWTIMLTVLVVGAASVLSVSRELRSGLFTRGEVDAEMFLFGLAFLLLETRSVTQMNLVWGATWLTSAVVFGSILAMILLATIWMQLKPLPYGACAAGLVISLVAAYLLPVEWLLGTGVAQKLWRSLLLVGTPIFFASACFAISFSKRASADRAFGWNLLGAVVGGLLEFVSMATSLRTLLLIALAGYALAFAVRFRRGGNGVGRAVGRAAPA